MIRKLTIACYVFWIKISQVFQKKTSKHILIIKPDAIGDYIIFRNFLSFIAASKTYANHKITLVGNSLWMDFANDFDGGLIYKFITVNHKTLGQKWISIFREVQKVNYDLVITYCYSRAFLTDIIAFVASSTRKVGIDGDTIRMSPALKKLCNRIVYDELVKVPDDLKTEFDFNRFLTEYVIKSKAEIMQPFLELPDSEDFDDFIPASPYMVIAPGAGVLSRRPTDSTWIEIASFMLTKYTICFVGSTEDGILVSNIMKGITPGGKFNMIDLTGEVPLKKLPFLLESAGCTICNDSGIYHLAVALNAPVLCIAGGGHFERFVRYPARENISVCYHDMPCYNCNWFCKFDFAACSPYPCIAAIDSGAVINFFSEIEDSS
jgi:ADP-heptose:LPS heptosyltransferase